MNNGELKTEIAALAHRDTLTPRIPKYIQCAETMIARRVRFIELLSSWLTSLADGDRVTPNGAIYNLPADCLELVAVRGSYGAAQFKVRTVGVAELVTYSTSAPPMFGSVHGRTLEIRGTPATGATFPLCYFKRPAALSADADTNNLLTNCEDLYIHAALHWLHVDAQDYEAAEVHKQQFESEADDGNRKAKRLLKSGAISSEAPATWGGSGM